ncbi:hypothetical protein PsYK624_129010 [Phanerochaete sordida]|uniref:Uncharacterized protein n=1 Tax=Phanerochaete sordida TaxID=48140 RepID=A0A9P3GJK1_9APHY|nr:hypothetical protein PsYK624_129010 [Phanerochaete sordida]
MPTVLPIDVLYPIVSKVVIGCIDELFTSDETHAQQEDLKISPPSAQKTVQALFATSLEVRRIALKVVADGLNVELSTADIWHLTSDPWHTIHTTRALAAQTIHPLTPSAAPPTRPVHAFFALLLSAQRDLAYAQCRLAALAPHKPSASASVPSAAAAEPLAYARHAACKAAGARDAAGLAPAVFRARLRERASGLEVRMYAFVHLRAGAHDLSAKLSALVGATDAEPDRAGAPGAADCLIALECALVSLQAASEAVHPADDALIGADTLTAVCDALRTVTSAAALSPNHTRSLDDAPETRARCVALAVRLLVQFEQRLAALRQAEREEVEFRQAQVRI